MRLARVSGLRHAGVLFRQANPLVPEGSFGKLMRYKECVPSVTQSRQLRSATSSATTMRSATMTTASRHGNPRRKGCSKCRFQKQGCPPSCHKRRGSRSCNRKGGKKAEKHVSFKTISPVQETFPDALVEATELLVSANTRSKVLKSLFEDAEELTKNLSLTVDTLQTKVEILQSLALGPPAAVPLVNSIVAAVYKHQLKGLM